jgi:uncharacterized membrane protein
MLPIQIHLGIVHVPVLAMVFATLLFLFSGFRDRVEWKRMAYFIYMLGAIGGLMAFFSGHGSEDMAQRVLELSRKRIHEHEEAGNFALAYCLVTGSLSFVLLFLDSKLSNSRRRLLGRILLVVGLLGCLALSRTAHLGGQIRHSEIASEPPSIVIPPKSSPESSNND